MKKKWLSCLLAAALLASSLMPSFTAVAEGNPALPAADVATVGGVDPATAVETVADDAAAADEVAAVAGDTAGAPVASVEDAMTFDAGAENEIAPVAAGDTFLVDVPDTSSGEQYQITVAQDFENYPYVESNGTLTAYNNVFVNGSRANSSIDDNGIKGTKSAKVYSATTSLTGTTFTQFRNFLELDKLTGEGLYFNFASNFTCNGTGYANVSVQIYRVDSPSTNNVVSGTQYYVGGFNYDKLSTKDDPAEYFIPWTDFNTQANKGGTTLDIDAFNNYSGVICVHLALRFDLIKAQEGASDLIGYMDNFGFYKEYNEDEIELTETYTERTNPLTDSTVSNSMHTNQNSTAGNELFDLAVGHGKGRFQFKRSVTNGTPWQNNMGIRFSGADLKDCEALPVTVKYTANIPGTFNLNLRQGGAAGNALSTSAVTTPSATESGYLDVLYTGDDYSICRYTIPLTELKDAGNTVNENANYYLTFTYASSYIETPDDYVEFWDVGVTHSTTQVASNSATQTKQIAVATQNGGTVTARVGDVEHKNLMAATIEVSEDTEITLTADTKDADGNSLESTTYKRFKNWAVSDVDNVTDESIAEAVNGTTYTAVFADLYKVTVNRRAGDDTNDGVFYTTLVEDGTDYTPLAPSYYKEGLAFTDWTVEGLSYDSDRTYSIINDVIFTPNYEEASFTGLFTIQVSGGTASVTGRSELTNCSYNDLVTFTAEEDTDGKYFVGWVDGYMPETSNVYSDKSELDNYLNRNPIQCYDREFKLLVKRSCSYTAIFVTTEELQQQIAEEAKSTLFVFDSKLEKADNSEQTTLTVVFEWRIPAGTEINGNVSLKITAKGDGRTVPVATVEAVQNRYGYYTVHIVFANESAIPDDFTVEATLTVNGQPCTATWNYSASSVSGVA